MLHYFSWNAFTIYVIATYYLVMIFDVFILIYINSLGKIRI